MRERRRAGSAVLITSAPKSRFEQLNDRRRRYLISMGIRTVCLLLAIAIPYAPARVVLVIAAVVLPWLSVVGANSPLGRDAGAPASLRPQSRPALGRGPSGDRDRPTG